MKNYSITKLEDQLSKSRDEVKKLEAQRGDWQPSEELTAARKALADCPGDGDRQGGVDEDQRANRHTGS